MIMIVTLVVISVVTFLLIKAPPGDFLSSYIASLGAGGSLVTQEEVSVLRIRFGLDQPIYVQYAKWIGGILRGDFGRSFYWQKPVSDIIREQMPLTIAVSLLTLVFIYVVSIPIGIYSAVRKYSVGDYAITTLGFIGLSVPPFLLALLLMFIMYKVFGSSIGGLVSRAYANAPFSFGKMLDIAGHLIAPVIVVGAAGTAGVIRIMRAMLLDELRKPYVQTNRAKGLKEGTMLLRYPVRIALNPIISTIGWQIPLVVSGFIIVSIVMDLPTIGSTLLTALLSEDMYLAGGIVLLLSTLTVVGTLVSDLLLAVADPRIRFERAAATASEG